MSRAERVNDKAKRGRKQPTNTSRVLAGKVFWRWQGQIYTARETERIRECLADGGASPERATEAVRRLDGLGQEYEALRYFESSQYQEIDKVLAAQLGELIEAIDRLFSTAEGNFAMLLSSLEETGEPARAALKEWREKLEKERDCLASQVRARGRGNQARGSKFILAEKIREIWKDAAGSKRQSIWKDKKAKVPSAFGQFVEAAATPMLKEEGATWSSLERYFRSESHKRFIASEEEFEQMPRVE